ncbi:MAG: stage III sporulation protein AB [Firmicutes bacterium]|nr:stage III sporulation protein AB [Bacillota bacterium]
MSVIWMQWIGSGSVVAGTASLGSRLAARYRDRPRELRELTTVLRALAAEITYARTPLVQALTRAGSSVPRPGVIRQFAQGAASDLKLPGAVLEVVWRTRVTQELAESSLTNEDLEIVNGLARTIGQTGVEEQTGALMAAIALLLDREREATAERSQYARLYVTLGVLAGVLIVVLLW